MYLIIGLGNPEPEYSMTRHNIGFDVINKLANKFNIKVEKKKFEGLCGTGDIEGEAEELLTEKLAGEKKTYNVLKASHHGSKGATTEEFLKAADPVLAVISAPKKSSYGHPGKETLQRIEDSGAFWLQTGLCGAVTVKFENGKLVAGTYR